MATDGDRVIGQVEVERGVVARNLYSIPRAGLIGACEDGDYRGAIGATLHGHITGLRTERHIQHIQDHW